MKNLMSKVLDFCQRYEREKSPALLNDCHQVREYIDVVKALNEITMKDLGVSDKALEEYFQRDTMIACEIIENPVLSIGFFIMPAETSLSLHDHPDMLVTTKVMCGKLQRRSMDLVDRKKQFELPQQPFFDIEDDPTEIRLDAVVECDTEHKAGDLINLTPTRGNLHEFKAIENTILFDVLTPYYDNKIRFCNFYKEVEPKASVKKKVKKVSKTGEAQEGKVSVPSEDKKKPGASTTLVFLLTPPPFKIKLINYEGESPL